ncbi:HNH restriction endonuclease [Pseudanabaena phage Pam1]|nr:HNH restriction endonuclease [Pseudanabaena phage Pam1]
MADAAYKQCASCKLEKPFAEFVRDARASTGLQPSCKACNNARRAARRRANIETVRARERAWFEQNRERVYANNAKSRERRAEAVRAGKKAYYERVKNTPEYIAKRDAYTKATKDKKREYDKRYRAQRPEKNLERATAWRKANPEKRAAVVRAYSARRRAQTDGGVSTRELHEWTMAQPKICYWCGAKCKKNYHVDHYEPLSRGGKHEIANLVIACAPCNLKKNAKDPLEFAREVGRLL